MKRRKTISIGVHTDVGDGRLDLEASDKFG